MCLRPAPLGLCLAVWIGLACPPTAAQDTPSTEGSEIGKLLLTLTTTDGRPIAGTRVVVDPPSQEPEVEVVTDLDGRVYVSVSPETLAAAQRAAFEFLYLRRETVDGASTLRGGSGDAAIAVPTITLRDAQDPEPCTWSARGVPVSELFAGGCVTSEPFVPPPSGELRITVDARCGALGDLYLQPEIPDLFEATLTSGTPAQTRDLTVGPAAPQFPDGPGGLAAACTDSGGDLPEVAVFALHGYNIDFEDGAWGVRAEAPLPLLPGRNVGAAVGLDYYPQDDSRSTLAVNVDATASFPWPALGDASAFVGAGPRAYRQSFDTVAGGSSSTEFGVGAVSGMRYGLGPAVLYGDVGVDYVYDTLVPVTHVGIGVAFPD